MVSCFMVLMCISSGSILCSTVWNKKYCEILPITCSAIVLIEFIFGILGSLIAGFWVALGLCTICYFICIYFWIVKRNFKNVLENTVTSGLVVFAGLCCIYILCSYRMLPMNIDEFSHWADIVKVMSYLDDFGTNPAAYSIFASYPPGMALFQYFFEKIHTFVTGASYSEWRLYLAYQSFAISFMMPFLKIYSNKKVGIIIITATAVFLCPTLFFPNFHSALFIDAFLGILFGTGLAGILLENDKDVFY